MDSDKIKALLAQALEKETPQERAGFLNEVCAEDPTAQAELESLLLAHDGAGDFLAAPAPELTAVLENLPLSEGPGTVIGPYKLLEKIGEGGMAVVYMAQQAQPLKRRAALKIIKLGMDTREVIARFEAERQALALMDHPNIAKVFDAGATDTGRPYFVMELVRGISITEYCDKSKLSTQDRLALFLSVCNAVHHAHQKGIIHRDLKPSNIMVTMHDDKPVPKVIDFGIAKATNRQLTEKTVFTRYAQMIGTPEYMSPEQAQMSGLDIDTRTDIYSLGIVLYELLTGALPFDGETLRSAGFAEVQRIIREEEPLRPSTRISTLGKAAEEIATRRDTNVAGLARRLYRELEWIPLKALRKDRTRRYTSASEFAQDINNYLNDQPLLAGPESTFYRLQKMVHKNRVQVISVSAVAAALIAGLVVSTWLYIGRSRAIDTVSELTDQAQMQEKLSNVQRLYAEGRYQEAINEIKTKFDEQDLDPQARLVRAQLLMELGKFDEAEAELLQLIEDKPEIASSAYYLLARLNRTADSVKADQYQKRAESILPQTAEGYYWRAMCAASAEEAITCLSKTLEFDSQHYAARKARAYAYNSIKNFQKMAEDTAVLVSQRPRDYLGYALRALSRRATGLLVEAVKDHTRAIMLCRREEEKPRLYNQRRETHMKNGNYRAALADARQHATLEPDTIVSHFQLFTALLALAEYEKAQAVYKGTAKPGDRSIWHFQGWLEGYVFDLLRSGQPFALPSDIAAQSPFYLMQQSADLYALLQRKAKPLAVIDGFWPNGDWSPDGKHLVYQRNGAFSWLPDAIEGIAPEVGTYFIEIMELQSGQTRQISQFGYSPLWSPDGKHIAFTNYYGNPNENADVWVVSAAGGKPHKLVAGIAAKWSPDSKRIYFKACPGRTICSIAVDVSDADPVSVFESPGSSLNRFAISPDESLIARQSSSRILVQTFPEGQDVARWELPWPLMQWVTQLQWHPNGKTVILNSRYFDNQMGMCLFDVVQEEATHIFNLTRPWCQTLWSPDGSQLIIDVFGGGPWILAIDPEQPLEEILAPALTTEAFLIMLRKRCDQRIAMDPLEAEHYVSRAVVATAVKDYDLARQDLIQCVTLIKDPNGPACHAFNHWAQMYGGKGSVESDVWRLPHTQLAEKFPAHFPELEEP